MLIILYPSSELIFTKTCERGILLPLYRWKEMRLSEFKECAPDLQWSLNVNSDRAPKFLSLRISNTAVHIWHCYVLNIYPSIQFIFISTGHWLSTLGSLTRRQSVLITEGLQTSNHTDAFFFGNSLTYTPMKRTSRNIWKTLHVPIRLNYNLSHHHFGRENSLTLTEISTFMEINTHFHLHKYATICESQNEA